MINIKSYVINIDARKDRLDAFNHNLLEYGYSKFNTQRISAIVDKDFGGIGCAKSHLIALCDYLVHSKDTHCMILEDDFRFRINSELFENILETTLKIKNDFKVFVLAGTEVISLKSDEDLFVTIFESQSTAGYIVSREYIRTLADIYIRSILHMEKFRTIPQRALIYNRFSIDQTWKRAQQEGGWISVLPMPGFQAESYSDIENKVVNYGDMSS